MPTVLSKSPQQRSPRNAEPQAGQRRGMERCCLAAGHDRVGARAVGDMRAIGPIESASSDSGNGAVESARATALGLKPTMPQSAAGMRVEPPVSEPIAISHMLSATATAPPDGDPPGTSRAIRRIARRAVMRVDADAGERELRSCWSCRRSPHRRRAIAARPARQRVAGAASANRRSSRRGRLARDVEQVLDR